MKKSLFLSLALVPTLTLSMVADAGTMTIAGSVFGGTYPAEDDAAMATHFYQANFYRQRIALGPVSGVAQVHAEFDGNFINTLWFSKNVSPDWLTPSTAWDEYCSPFNCTYTYAGMDFGGQVINPIALPAGYNSYTGRINQFGSYSAADDKSIVNFSVDFGAASPAYLFLATTVYFGSELPGFSFTLTGAGVPDQLVQVYSAPIPGALWLMGSALAGLAAASRRKR